MKKALIFLLSLAVVGAVFAQDAPTLTFSGSLQTGVVYTMGDDVLDPMLVSYAKDADKLAYRLRLAGTAVNGNTGAKFRISSNGESTDKQVAVDFAWAYVDLLDAMVHIDLGYKVDDSIWRTKGDDELDYDVDNEAKVQIKAVEGLNFGFAIGFDPIADDATTPLVDEEAAGPELADATFIGGVAYAMAPFGVQAGFKAAMGDLTAAYAGFDYTDVIPGLNVYLETELTKLEDFSNIGKIQIDEKVKYVTGPIEVGLISYQYLYQNSDVDMGLIVKPYAAYTMGINTFKLEVTYNNDEASISGDYAGYVDAAEPEYSTLTVEPTITSQFTDKTKIVTGFKYVAFTDMAYDNRQWIYVNFRYDF
jgi:hypothetical protein